MSAMMVGSFTMCTCTMGKAPATLNATSAPTVLIENKPAATIMDFAPGTNIMPPFFGLCSSPANPAVIAAAGAPVPCTPAPAGTWAPPHSKVFIKNKPALADNCKLTCTLGGVISIVPGTAATHTTC